MKKNYWYGSCNIIDIPWKLLNTPLFCKLSFQWLIFFYNLTEGNPGIQNSNKSRTCIKYFFPRRKCFVFSWPISNKKQLAHLDKVSEDQLEPDFKNQSEKFRSHIFTIGETKTLRQGIIVTGNREFLSVKSFLSVVQCVMKLILHFVYFCIGAYGRRCCYDSWKWCFLVKFSLNAGLLKYLVFHERNPLMMKTENIVTKAISIWEVPQDENFSMRKHKTL